MDLKGCISVLMLQKKKMLAERSMILMGTSSGSIDTTTFHIAIPESFRLNDI